MHSAAAKLDPALFERVVALVLYGDPGNRGPNVKSPLGGTVPPFPEVLANRVQENCAKQDPVCSNSMSSFVKLVLRPWI
jgi:hypothetical protein